jgi:hypothetical protein
MRSLIFVGCALMLALCVLPWIGCGDDGDDYGVCELSCAKFAECGEEYPECEQDCRLALDLAAVIGAQCRDALEGLSACLGNLPTCEELEDFYSGVPPNSYPCDAAENAFDDACDFGR